MVNSHYCERTHDNRAKQNILFVDDNINIHRGIDRLLRQKRVEYSFYFSSGVDEALVLMKEREIDAVISDIKMPGRDGFDFVRQLRKTPKWRDLPIVMLTGQDSPKLKSKALDAGATDLLNKPVNLEDLLARIRSMLCIKKRQDKLQQQKNDLEQVLRKRTETLESTQLDMIWRLGKMAEFRSEESGNHMIRVGHYSRILAEKLGLSYRDQEMIFMTSPLHDVGKIAIPDSILFKKGRLSSSEWETMQTHCIIGQKILAHQPEQGRPVCQGREHICESYEQENNPFLEMAADIAGSHHEQWLGGGYPRGLVREAIPLAARIAAVSDVYDALRSKRVYKAAISHTEALMIMGAENGIRFDPCIFNAFEQCLTTFQEIQHQYG